MQRLNIKLFCFNLNPMYIVESTLISKYSSYHMIPLLTHTWASSPHTSLPWFLQTDMETTWRWLLTGTVRCAVAKMLPPPDRCTACPTEVGGWWQCPQLAQPSPWCGAGAACSCRARQSGVQPSGNGSSCSLLLQAVYIVYIYLMQGCFGVTLPLALLVN